MLVRSKAPLRLGLAGGGTDVSPYCDTHGGLVLNATIDKYAYCTLEPTTNRRTLFCAVDQGKTFESASQLEFELRGDLLLHKAVYNRIVCDYNGNKAIPLKMTTYSDAPAGSGLGSSSTIVVAMIKAYVELLNLPLGDYEIAHLAYVVEREDVGLAGGRQDQYAATFGGFNFMEFLADGAVIINPLRMKKWALNELQNSMLLYYLGTSRDSAKIIDEQIKSTQADQSGAMLGMHDLKESAIRMKNCLLKGDFDGFAWCLEEGWEAKKKTSHIISTPEIEDVHAFIMANGGKSAKISGAGGGGFMMIICDPVMRHTLTRVLEQRGQGFVLPVSFTEHGTQAWTLY
jgi:D-glycero-alpha-D-manno-heptose-7-phosphate kinase